VSCGGMTVDARGGVDGAFLLPERSSGCETQ
jgi:hypothetical protein